MDTDTGRRGRAHAYPPGSRTSRPGAERLVGAGPRAAGAAPSRGPAARAPRRPSGHGLRLTPAAPTQVPYGRDHLAAAANIERPCSRPLATVAVYVGAILD